MNIAVRRWRTSVVDFLMLFGDFRGDFVLQALQNNTLSRFSGVLLSFCQKYVARSCTASSTSFARFDDLFPYSISGL